MSWSSKPQAQVWQTKSFASAIRGAAASGPPPGLGGPSPTGGLSNHLHSVQGQVQVGGPKGPTEIMNLTHNHFQQKLSQANISSHLKHLNDQHQVQVDKINEIMTLLKQLENMINDQTNTEDYMKTREALQMNMAERREKKSRLLHEIRELEQLERVQELNNEINDDSDDIFNQIEIERRKGYQEYIERLTPDSNQSYSEDDEQNISNTTPEPARTPTMFNVNASEFKPSPKRNSGSPALSTNENGLTKLETSPSNNTSSTSPTSTTTTTSPTVTYHQPGYMILPVRTATQALSTVPNNLVVMRTPQPLYIPNNQKF